MWAPLPSTLRVFSIKPVSVLLTHHEKGRWRIPLPLPWTADGVPPCYPRPPTLLECRGEMAQWFRGDAATTPGTQSAHSQRTEAPAMPLGGPGPSPLTLVRHWQGGSGHFRGLGGFHAGGPDIRGWQPKGPAQGCLSQAERRWRPRERPLGVAPTPALLEAEILFWRIAKLDPASDPETMSRLELLPLPLMRTLPLPLLGRAGRG
jgi:hypothetical protein